MAAGKSSKKPSQFMDVSKPGKIAPTASSRPIIVGHEPTVQDPMVTEDGSATPEELRVDVKRTAPKVITPLNAVKELENVDEPAMSDMVSEPSADETETPAEEDTTTEQAQSNAADEKISGASDAVSSTGESKSAKDPSDKSSSVVDAVVGQATKEKDKKSDKKIEELEKRQAEIEKLIEEKKYFVHTTQVTKKQRKNRWASLVLLLLVIVGAYLAVDAQVIKNNIQLPYEFFKEESTDKTTDSQASVNNKSSEENKTEQAVADEIFVSKESGVSFRHPEGWAVEFEPTNECPVLSTDFEQATTVNGGMNVQHTSQVKCPYTGTIRLGEKGGKNTLAGMWLFTNSPKSFDATYIDYVNSADDTKYEKSETKSGLHIIVSRASGGDAQRDNLYVVELAPGTYLWINNTEYRATNPADPTDSTTGSNVTTDVRKYSQQVRDLVDTIKYAKP